MPANTGFVLLEEKTKELLDALRQIHFHCQKQKDFFEKSEPAQILEYAKQKGERIRKYQAVLAEVAGLAHTLRVQAPQRVNEIDALLVDCQRQCSVLIDEIVGIETKDKIMLGAIKEAVTNEIDEIKKTRAQLGALRGSYIPTDKAPNLFDQRT